MDKVATYVRVSNHSNAENAVRNQTKKVMDFCEAKGYEVCDSAAVIGNRELAYPMMMKGRVADARKTTQTRSTPPGVKPSNTSEVKPNEST